MPIPSTMPGELMITRRQWMACAGTGVGLGWAAGAGYVLFGGSGGPRLLNASYDATRDLYRDIDRAFVTDHTSHNGRPVRVTPSHGGSGSQARAVIDGLPADVATLAIWPDTQRIADAGLIAPGWEDRYPHRSLPYTSTIVFLVRKGNPFAVRSWRDIADRPVAVVAANPKTSGAAKLAVIAAWGSVATAGGTPADADDFTRSVYRKVPALESSSRAATVTFIRKQIGDVLLTWESEAWLAAEANPDAVEIVWPADGSVRAEPHVALIRANTTRRGTTALADAYLSFLYEPDSKVVMTRHGLRPCDPRMMGPTGRAEYGRRFGRLPDAGLYTVDGVFPAGGWAAAQARLFADGGLFDAIYAPG